jgi:hypothetical protein
MKLTSYKKINPSLAPFTKGGKLEFPLLEREGVKKLGESVKRRYLQSFRIAAFDGHRSQDSVSV